MGGQGRAGGGGPAWAALPLAVTAPGTHLCPAVHAGVGFNRWGVFLSEDQVASARAAHGSSQYPSPPLAWQPLRAVFVSWN